MEHHIETGNTALIKLPPRHIPLTFIDEDWKELEKLKRWGVIQSSMLPWVAPLAMVWKHCGAPRMCLDYWRLNAVTKNVAYPISQNQDCLDTVAGVTVFSTMDIITAAYHQIPVAEEDIPKTAFFTKYGLYEFKTLKLCHTKQLPKHTRGSWNCHCQDCSGQLVWFIQMV